MPRTRITQSILLGASDVFDDTKAPSLAEFETNPVSIEDDLNNARSMLSMLKDAQAGNWYDALVTPSALEAGTPRGVDTLNDALHLLEKKRVLQNVCSLVDIAVPASAFATGTLTNATNFLDTETVTIDAKVYTFQAALTDVDGNVQIGASVALSHENLRRAINLDGVAGTDYATSMTIHPTVGASDTATTTVVTAKVAGGAGNSIATTETAVTGTWATATLLGGGGDVLILGAGELPTQTTAAVGAVTTLGTVVATATTFGTAGLDEVAGVTAISPKNLTPIVDASTRDPLLSGGRTIHGLLQGESGLTDGTTITDTTATRVQISFVRLNSTGSDLELVPLADIAGQNINYCTRERVRSEDLNEDYLLSDVIIDVPAGTSVSRQVGYDNQGTTPVDLTTNATIDLEGPGLAWIIRDDLEATLIRVLEGSAGGTSEFQVGADVDVFNVDALVNDFAEGARFDTGGQRINIGETAGTVESTGANDLRIFGARELFLDDVNQAGSSWAQTDGVKLSDTTAEWNAYETEFGGELSLLAAIVAASNSASRTKVQALATVNVLADVDVNGPTYANNLDVDLPPYDQVNFVTDVDVFVDGVLLRCGANAAANEDVYPGTSPANGDLRFELPLRGVGSNPNPVTVIVNGQ